MIVIMEGWEKGMEKVSLTKLQTQQLGLSLKDAKTNVDSLLDGKTVTIEVADNFVAKEFINAAQRIGVKCRQKE